MVPSSKTTTMKGKEAVGLFWKKQGWEKKVGHHCLALQGIPEVGSRGLPAKGGNMGRILRTAGQL